MKRRGFISRVLAALGVGAVAGGSYQSAGATVTPPPASSCSRCDGVGLIPCKGHRPVFPSPPGARIKVQSCVGCQGTGLRYWHGPPKITAIDHDASTITIE